MHFMHLITGRINTLWVVWFPPLFARWIQLLPIVRVLDCRRFVAPALQQPAVPPLSLAPLALPARGGNERSLALHWGFDTGQKNTSPPTLRHGTPSTVVSTKDSGKQR